MPRFTRVNPLNVKLTTKEGTLALRAHFFTGEKAPAGIIFLNSSDVTKQVLIIKSLECKTTASSLQLNITDRFHSDPNEDPDYVIEFGSLHDKNAFLDDYIEIKSSLTSTTSSFPNPNSLTILSSPSSSSSSSSSSAAALLQQENTAPSYSNSSSRMPVSGSASVFPLAPTTSSLSSSSSSPRATVSSSPSVSAGSTITSRSSSSRSHSKATVSSSSSNPSLSAPPSSSSSSASLNGSSSSASSSAPAPRQPHHFDFKAAYVQQESISLIAKIRRALTSFVKGLYSILTTLSLRKHREWALQNQPLVKIPLQQFNTLNAIRSGMDTPKVDGHPEPSAASVDEDSAYFDIASLERLQRYQSKSNDGKLSFSAVEKVEVRDSKLQTLQVESRLGQAFRK